MIYWINGPYCMFDGDIYIPMTLVYEDSFKKIQKPLEECGIEI